MTGSHWSLNPWKGILEYLGAVQQTIQSWELFFKKDFSTDWYREDELAKWISSIAHTVEVIRYAHVYNTSASLSIASAGSGFPEQYHIHQLRQSSTPQLSDTASLKRAALDDLFSRGHMNHWFLEQIAQSCVKDLLLHARTLSPFRIWSVKKTEKREGHYVYRVCFERYCYRNQPSLYLVYFETDAEMSEVVIAEVAHILEEETTRLPLLGDFAQALDRAHALISPIWIGRISIGPMFISHLTKDEHELQRVLNQHAEPGRLEVASRIIYEHIATSGSVPTQRLIDPYGRAHQHIQEFAIRQIDAECSVRKVSFVEKFLFASHRTAQALSEKFRQEIGHRLITKE